jgi:hypothetical protein
MMQRPSLTLRPRSHYPLRTQFLNLASAHALCSTCQICLRQFSAIKWLSKHVVEAHVPGSAVAAGGVALEATLADFQAWADRERGLGVTILLTVV